jgi:hypothetical protein
MLRFGLVALTGALTFLLAPSQTNATVGVGSVVADSLVDKGVIELVHFSRRYGWHCGMRKYDHEHRETCQRTREHRYWGDSEGSRYGGWRRRSFGPGGRAIEN